MTNIRSPDGSTTAAKSRGFLTSGFLNSNITARNYLDELVPSLDSFAGFNLLLGDQKELYFLNSQDREVLKLKPGIYGLSNGKLDSPWPKVNQGKKRLKALLEQKAAVDIGSLIEIMTDKEIAADEKLPNTGVPIELERLLSASFIRNPQRDYGTRCSTAVVVDDKGGVRFNEQNYNDDTTIASRNFFHFPIQQHRD